ncbi:hypothetical protein BASA50_009491 [Batrachochytrium salamandrivorans]|uniref:Autophagy-related protein 14 n=1 Tax=Batrachochytrium salamandrivorans TaxID=1357716 RepID=A0ABQ8F1K3_9FUNG|nr:hypothetical protein BASA50_009491 [Batrachochytrium salamandrivorans]
MAVIESACIMLVSLLIDEIRLQSTDKTTGTTAVISGSGHQPHRPHVVPRIRHLRRILLRSLLPVTNALANDGELLDEPNPTSLSGILLKGVSLRPHSAHALLPLAHAGLTPLSSSSSRYSNSSQASRPSSQIHHQQSCSLGDSAGFEVGSRVEHDSNFTTPTNTASHNSPMTADSSLPDPLSPPSLNHKHKASTMSFVDRDSSTQLAPLVPLNVLDVPLTSPLQNREADPISDTAMLPDGSWAENNVNAPEPTLAVDIRPELPHNIGLQPLAKRLHELRLTPDTGPMSSSTSSASVHQMFQEHLSTVFYASCDRLYCSYFTLSCSEEGVPFYISEWADWSNNPSWEIVLENIEAMGLNLHLSQFQFTLYVYCVDSASVLPFLSRSIALTEMTFIGKDLADLDTQLFNNTVLIELDDGLYIPTTTYAKGCKSKDDSDVALRLTKVKTRNAHASYKYALLKKLIDIQCRLADLRSSTSSILAQSSDYFSALEADEFRVREAENINARICVIENAIMEQTHELQARGLRLAEMRLALQDRRIHLAKLQAEKSDETKTFMRARGGLSLTRKEMSRILAQLVKRRKLLIDGLRSFFPLTETDGFCIRGIKLPNSNFTGQDDERIATALGFAVHFITLLAYYLDVPLRYYIIPVSSRSTVWDVVSQQFQGSKEFPLYARGSERIRFEYAVFLVNKNVEQLLNYVGRPIKNLRNTLPNLMLLCDTIDAWRELDEEECLGIPAVDWAGMRGSDATQAMSDSYSAQGSTVPSEMGDASGTYLATTPGDKPNIKTINGPTEVDLQHGIIGASRLITRRGGGSDAGQSYLQYQIPTAKHSPDVRLKGPIQWIEAGGESHCSTGSYEDDSTSDNGTGRSYAEPSLSNFPSEDGEPVRESMVPSSLAQDSSTYPDGTVSLDGTLSANNNNRQAGRKQVRHVSSAPRLSLLSRLLWGSSEPRHSPKLEMVVDDEGESEHAL